MALYRVRTIFSGVPGTPWVNTAYFLDSGGTAAQAASAVATFWGATDNLMDADVTWITEPDVATIDIGDGQMTGLTSTGGGTGVGSAAGVNSPPALQGLLRLRTASFVNGRNLRGRWFFPGLSEDALDNGVLGSAYIAAINTAANTLIADANSTLAIWSRTHGVASAVASASTWNQFAVLRSRRD